MMDLNVIVVNIVDMAHIVPDILSIIEATNCFSLQGCIGRV